MDCMGIALMILDIVGFIWLVHKVNKNRFKKRYHLSNKRIYFFNLH